VLRGLLGSRSILKVYLLVYGLWCMVYSLWFIVNGD